MCYYKKEEEIIAFDFIAEKNIILKAEPRVGSHDLMLFSLKTLSASIEEVALSYLSTVDNIHFLFSQSFMR